MSQVVKKEIIKLSVDDIEIFRKNHDLSRNTADVLDKLDFIVCLKSIQTRMPISMAVAFGLKSLNEISFQDLANYENGADGIENTSIEQVRSAAKELEEKGYLFRDTDGCLAFAPTGSMQ